MQTHPNAVKVLAGVAALALFLILWPFFFGDWRAIGWEGDAAASVELTDAKIILPPRAGAPARVAFDLANSSNKTATLSEIVVEHGGRARIVDISPPAPGTQSNLEIAPATVRHFRGDDQQLLLSKYGSSMVPGAEASIRLRFGDGSSVEAAATVVKERARVPAAEARRQLSRSESSASSPDP